MNLETFIPLTDTDLAIEQAQFLVEKNNIPYSIVKVKSHSDERLYVVPTSIVMEVFLMETFFPVGESK